MTGLAMIGCRVVVPDGSVGHVEEIDENDGLCRVRLLTPDDKPSACSTWVEPDRLSDGTNVRPQPRSKAWKAEAQAFCLGVLDALQSQDLSP